MGLILDSSVLIAAERRRVDLPAFFAAHPDESFYIAAITAAELLHGVERAVTVQRRAARSEFVENLLLRLPVIEFDLATARTHARLWSSLAQAGRIIGPHDLLIAATALEHQCMIATLNLAEFERVAGLRIADVGPFMIGTVKT